MSISQNTSQKITLEQPKKPFFGAPKNYDTVSELYIKNKLSSFLKTQEPELPVKWLQSPQRQGLQLQESHEENIPKVFNEELNMDVTTPLFIGWEGQFQ